MHDSPAPSILNSPNGDFRRMQGPSPEPPSPLSQSTPHKRYATSPNIQRPPRSPSPNFQHNRAITDGYTPNTHGYFNHSNQENITSGSTSRKPGPRPQVPPSAARDVDDHGGIRVTLPSTVSSDLENMTGIGTATSSVGWRGRELPTPQEVIYEASPEKEGASTRPTSPLISTPVAARPRSSSPGRYRALRPVSTRSKTPPLLKSNPVSPTTTPTHPLPTPPAQTQTPSSGAPSQPQHGRSSSSTTIPLLSPGVFRDSAFSSNSDATVEIPIKWTGGNVGDGGETRDRGKRKSSSPGLMVPGSWAPTPVQELPEEGHITEDAHVNNNHSGKQAVQEVASRVPLPEVRHPSERQIRSEIGSVGMILPQPSPSPPPPPPPPSSGLSAPSAQSKSKGKESLNDGGMQGWVLVNVEGKNHPRSPEVISSLSSPQSPNGTAKLKSSSEHGAMSAPAKTIAMVDAIEAKSKPKSKSNDPSPSGFKRLFGLRKNSVSVQICAD